MCLMSLLLYLSMFVLLLLEGRGWDEGERASSLISIERDRETGGDNKGTEGGGIGFYVFLSLRAINR